MTGSVGDLVGYIDKKGRVQMRSKAETYHDANTKKQRATRTAFLAITGLAKGMKDCMFGLAPIAKQKRISLRNSFVKENFKKVEVYAGDSSTAETDFTELVLSKGDLPSVEFNQIDTHEALTVTVPFGSRSDDPDAREDDNVYIAVYHPKSNKSVLSMPVRRNAGTISVTVPRDWNGENVKVYGFVQGYGSEAAYTEYMSVFNDAHINGGEAESALRFLQTQTTYSNSKYLGEATIS